MILRALLILIITTGSATAFTLSYEDGVKQYQKGNIQEALKVWKKAAEEDDIRSQYQYGTRHLLGDKGLSKNYKIAFKWLSIAANKNYMLAQYNLAQMYSNGWHVEKNQTKALELYEQAGKQGHVKAQNNAGTFYYNGYGTKKDYKKAFIWHQAAAKKGHAGAQNDLGILYYFGHGVKKNLKTSFEWQQKSALQGNHNGQRSLSLAYVTGSGVKRNDLLAYMWMSVSVQNKETKIAREFLTKFQQGMSKSMVQKGRLLAKTCLKTNYKKCG